VAQATELLTAAAAVVDAQGVSAVEAGELARSFARAEKIAAAAAVRLARVTGDPGGLLCTVTGTAEATARRKLAAVEAASRLPALEAGLRDGSLSFDQASVLVPVAAVSSADAQQLAREAASGISLPELKAKAARRMRARRSEADEGAREQALHARRYCRVYERHGGVRLDAFLAGVDAARVASALRAKTDTVARAAWDAGGDETIERYRADALVALVSGARVSTQVVLRVDAAALVRDELLDDEQCQIDGLGEVSLSTARSLLPDAVATTLVRAGQDVRTISSASRVIPRRIRAALAERDRCCVVPGCGRTQGLEIDHWSTDFSAKGLTELANLCRLCPPHHRMKTRAGWRLQGGPGRWRWVRPRT
jgi:hypothetical protein